MSERDVELHKQAFELYTQGLSLEEIGTQLGISPNTLRYWKSARCQCVCGYHGWIDFKKKLQVQVPATIVESVSAALQPKMTVMQMVALLENICSEALTSKSSLRPRTWRELLETFKLIIELKKSYGSSTDDEFEMTEVHSRSIKGSTDLQLLVNQFMTELESAKKPKSNVVSELLKQSLEE